MFGSGRVEEQMVYGTWLDEQLGDIVIASIEANIDGMRNNMVHTTVQWTLDMLESAPPGGDGNCRSGRGHAH